MNSNYDISKIKEMGKALKPYIKPLENGKFDINDEYGYTPEYINKVFNKQKYLTIEQIARISKWKMGWRNRQLHNILKNETFSPIINIFEITTKVYHSKDPKEQIKLLTKIRGIGVPTASSILAMMDPNKYGVIDIRAWKALYFHRVVENRESEKGFTPEDFGTYTEVIRLIAKELKTTPRIVDVALYTYHKSL